MRFSKIFLLVGAGGYALPNRVQNYYFFFKYYLRSGCKAVWRYKRATWLKLATLHSSFHKSYKQNINEYDFPHIVLSGSFWDGKLIG